MLTRLVSFFVIVLAVGLSAARGQVEASLHAIEDRFPVGTREVVVGVKLTHAEHWHTYWLQPGTGLPTTIEWRLPPGWSAGPLRWPAPKRVYDTSGNLAGNGYDGVVYLPVVLTPPSELRAGESVKLSAKVDWLMCKDRCVPGSAEVGLTLTPVAPDQAGAVAASGGDATALRNVWTTLPGVAPDSLGLRAVRRPGDAKALWIEAEAGAMPAGEPWFFDAEAGVGYDLPQAVDRGDGARLALRLTLADYVTATPERLRGVLTFAGGSAYELDLPVEVAAASGPEAAGAGSFVALLAVAFVGGLVLNLMPCVFPVLGLKVMGFVRQSGQDRKKITAHGLVFTSGVLSSFWLLAGVLAVLRAGGSQLGWGFQLQEPGFVFVMAIVLLGFAMNMSGVFEFGLGATAVGGELQQKQGYAGSFFTGVLATVVATPCSAPFLAPALGAALALPVSASFAVFTAIGLGLCAPYLALAGWPAAVKWLPRPGAWMETFKQGMAFLLYATVALMIWILAGQLSPEGLLSALLGMAGLSFALWVYGRATAPGAGGRRGLLALSLALVAGAAAYGWPRAAAADAIVWEPWSAERLAELRREGRPVYVDFTARWCFTCQTNKKTVFHGPGSDAVLRAFRERKVAALRGDWTNRDPLITAELARWSRAAVPFNLVYLPGRDEPVILPELLTARTVLDALTGGEAP